jgi:hypothetical protein
MTNRAHRSPVYAMNRDRYKDGDYQYLITLPKKNPCASVSVLLPSAAHALVWKRMSIGEENRNAKKQSSERRVEQRLDPFLFLFEVYDIEAYLNHP